MIESRMAYGIRHEKLSEKCKDTGNIQYKITFVALSSRPMILKLNKDKIPRCFAPVNNVPSCLTSLMVNTTENFIGLPTVNYILMMGIRQDDNKYIEERIEP